MFAVDVWNEDGRDQYVQAFNRKETYIPFRPADLCLLVVRELSRTEGRHAEENFDALIEFNRRLSAVVKLTVAQRFDEWQDSYVTLDPDVDVLLHESFTRPDESLKSSEKFQRILKRALDDGSFEKLTEQDFNEALDERSVLGLNVTIPSKTEIQTIIFARGRRLTTAEIPNWKTLWLTTKAYELKMYQRVVLLLWRQSEESQAPWCNLLNYLPSSPESTLSKSIKPGKMYFKIFKDIEVSDVDMLIPGSKVQFTNLDLVLLIAPLLLGICSAVWKAADGTLDFDTMSHAMTSAGLVILPLVYAARAYIGFRNKQNAYQANLLKKLSLQTVANNSGALTSILDEVADQETMDAFLAYAFLWKGRHAPQDMARSQLTREIEGFVNQLLGINRVDTQIIFNAKSACDKLQTMGLLQKQESIASDAWIRAVDMETALKELSSVNISKKMEHEALGSKRPTTEFQEVNIDLRAFKF